MNWKFDRVLYFLAVAEEGSISKAARRLYVSPQALNKQVAALEAELGGKLFHRTTRSLELTPLGRMVQEKMLPVRQSYRQAGREIEEYLDRETGELRFTFFPAISKRLVLLPVVNELMARLPKARVKLEAADLDDLIVSLREGRADLAVANLDEWEQIGDLETLPLLESSAQVFISHRHPWATKPCVTEAQLAAAPILLLDRQLPTNPGSFYNKRYAGPHRVVSDTTAMLATLQMGKEYAVFPYMVENLQGFGLVSFPLPRSLAFSFRTALLFRADSRFAPVFRRTHKTILEENIIDSMAW